MTNTRHSNELYAAQNCGYTSVIAGYKIEPIIIQPLPAGAVILAKRYNQKYNININIVDHTNVVQRGDVLKDRFAKFRETFDIKKFEEGKPVGFLLMHGLQHVVSFIISRENNKVYMIIFDSTSGSRKGGYKVIANMFAECEVLLNDGTRQADVGSCVADGLCMLKDGLRMPNLGTYIFNEKLLQSSPRKDTRTPGRPTFFGTQLTQDNYFIFRMPEELLKSAQVSQYVDNATPDLNRVITKNNETLGERRERDRAIVSFNNSPSVDVGINRYLHKKSHQYAQIIDDSNKLAAEAPFERSALLPSV